MRHALLPQTVQIVNLQNKCTNATCHSKWKLFLIFDSWIHAVFCSEQNSEFSIFFQIVTKHFCMDLLQFYWLGINFGKFSKKFFKIPSKILVFKADGLINRTGLSLDRFESKISVNVVEFFIIISVWVAGISHQILYEKLNYFGIYFCYCCRCWYSKWIKYIFEFIYWMNFSRQFFSRQ